MPLLCLELLINLLNMVLICRHQLVSHLNMSQFVTSLSTGRQQVVFALLPMQVFEKFEKTSRRFVTSLTRISNLLYKVVLKTCRYKSDNAISCGFVCELYANRYFCNFISIFDTRFGKFSSWYDIHIWYMLNCLFTAEITVQIYMQYKMKLKLSSTK